MKTLHMMIAALATATLLAACSRSDAPQPAEDAAARSDSSDAAPGAGAALPEREIAPGLTMRMLKAGSGAVAAAGDTAVVHYTGWLYDEAAPDKRGQKFDSSVDRGQHFRFPVGGRRVIRGWDEGVVGMRVGEVRELTIAPEMGYGDRGAGNVIPPGATLVFEVELAAIEGDPASKEGQ